MRVEVPPTVTVAGAKDLTMAAPVWTVTDPLKAALVVGPSVVVTAPAPIVFVTFPFRATFASEARTRTCTVTVQLPPAGRLAPVTRNEVSAGSSVPAAPSVNAPPQVPPVVTGELISSGAGRLSVNETFVSGSCVFGFVSVIVTVLTPAGSTCRTFGLKAFVPVRARNGETVSVAFAACGFEPWSVVVTLPAASVLTYVPGIVDRTVTTTSQRPELIPSPAGMVPPESETWVAGATESDPPQPFDTGATTVTFAGSVSTNCVPPAAAVAELKRLIVIVEVCPGTTLIGAKLLFTSTTAAAGAARRTSTAARPRSESRPPRGARAIAAPLAAPSFDVPIRSPSGFAMPPLLEAHPTDRDAGGSPSSPTYANAGRCASPPLQGSVHGRDVLARRSVRTAGHLPPFVAPLSSHSPTDTFATRAGPGRPAGRDSAGRAQRWPAGRLSRNGAATS